MNTEPEPVSDERLRQAVRDVLTEELDQNDDQPSATRRQVLGSIAAGGVLGGLAGAGSAAGATGGEDTSGMVGALAGPPYLAADPGLYTGPDSAKSNVSHDIGQYFQASDTRLRYYDDGTNWEIVSALETALNARHVVGTAPNYFNAVDPTDYASDDAAMQAVVDDLQTQTEPGHLWFSPFGPDGNELTIESTVNIQASNGPLVFPKGYGFFGNDGAYLRTTIDNGDPMFLVEDGQAQLATIGGFAASTDGTTAQDAELLRIRDVADINVDRIEARALGGATPTASGMIVLDSNTNNARFTRLTFNGNTDSAETPDVSGSNCIAIVDSAGNAPGQNAFSLINSYAAPSSPVNSIITQTASAGDTRIVNSRIEGAGGTAGINVTSGDAIVSSTQIGRMENGADGISLTGTRGHVGPAVIADLLGDGGTAVVLEIGFGGSMLASELTGGATNDGLVVNAAPSNNTLVIMDRGVIQGGTSVPSSTAIQEIQVAQT